MTFRLAVAVFAAAMLAGAAAHAGCAISPSKVASHQKPKAATDCVINFNSVPDISKKIVADELKGRPLPLPHYAEPAQEPYTGPMVGGAGSSVGSMIRRTPEIGYKWSIN